MSIRLVRAYLQRDLREPDLWNGAAFFAEVENLGYQKVVGVRVEPDLELECSYLTTLRTGREIWVAYWSDFGFFPARHPDLSFALRYRVAGKVFADPEGDADGAAGDAGHVLNERRPCTVGEGHLAASELRACRFADAAAYDAFAASAREPLEGMPLPPAARFPAVVVWGWVHENVAGAEEVVARLTADGAPVEGVLAAKRLPEGRWFFVHHHPGTAEMVEVTVGCRSGGATVWDDNFGKRHFLVVEAAP